MNPPAKNPTMQPQRLSDLKKRDLTAHTRQLSEINNMLSGPTIEFPVEEFRRDFLPYFCGQIPATELVIRAWISVSKSLLKSVSLTDASGAVVATVPALAVNNVTQPLDPQRRKHADADSAMTMATRAAELSPNAALATVHNRLGARFRMWSGREDPELKRQWEALFDYFDVEMRDPTKPAEAKAGAAPADPGIELDFDAL